MNIFENESGILGSTSVGHLNHSFKEFFRQAAEIRSRLRKQRYLLDTYLTYLFEGANEILAYESASEGFEAGNTLNSLCGKILRGDEKGSEHPFYTQVKAFIDAHPLQYQELTTRESLYGLILSCDFLEPLCQQYHMDIVSSISTSFDIVDLSSLYKTICETMGGEKEMEQLNSLFCQRFLTARAMDIFLQGMTNQLLYALTYRDKETSKQMFQLLLDEASYHG